MKIDKIILISLLLLILTLGAVSASQDTAISDNVTSADDVDIVADDDDDGEEDFDEYEYGTGTVNPNVEVNWPDEIKAGEFAQITFKLPEDMKSKVLLFINNERVDSGQDARANLPYEVFIDEFGKNTVKFQFYGDDKYSPVAKSKTYNINDYYFDAKVENENVIYGQVGTAKISFPFGATGTITVGNEKYQINDGESSITVPLKNLQLGTNQIPVSCSWSDKYGSKSAKLTVNVKPGIIYSPQMKFNNATFILRLPANAVGNLEVSVDGDVKTSKLTNGLAEISLDGLALGGHDFKARYTGNDYACENAEGHFEITPEIIVNSFKTPQDENSIQINLPKGETGKMNVKISRFIEGEVSFVADEKTKSAQVEDGFVMPLSTFYWGHYRFDITYSSNSGYFYSMSADGYVKDIFEMNITAPETVLSNQANIPITVDFLTAEDGLMTLYVDGEFYDVLECEDLNSLEFNIEDGFNTGNHNVTLSFSGNNRYSPLEKSVNLVATDLVFTIPEAIVIGENDEISVKSLPSVTGNLVVYVDGKEFGRKAIKNGYASVSMASLPFKTYTVKVSYEKGNLPSVSKTVVMNVSYTFKPAEETAAYSDDELYVIDIPEGLSTDKLVVKVDNVQYEVIKNGTEVGINASGLEMGNHVISISHPGEGNYYPLSVEKTISVAGKINVPSEIKIGEDNHISLVLPKDPQGRLVLSEYDENYKVYAAVTSFGFAPYGDKSIAEIPLSYLGFGNHKMKISYSGTDYVVADEYKEISVNLDLKFDKYVQYGKKATVTITLPYAEGAVDVSLDSEYSDVVEFVNGVATIDFGKLGVGQHYFELSYYGSCAFDYEAEILVYPAISVPTSTIIDGDKAITVTSDANPVGSIIVYDGANKLKSVDLDGGKQSISLAGLSAGTHKLSIVYDGWDSLKYTANYTVTAKKASISGKDMSMFYLDGSKFKVQVKDYKGKAVKKGQSVKFYVDGKLVTTAKTDAKGYASVVLTHAPGKHTVKAVYKATTLTKKVTVKQVLTLKKVTVKKSAKSLKLTATLKKVKGKSINNVKITFKFGKHKYVVFTSSKGVATATVQANVLKALKVGNTVNYQATYEKATVKLSVKVAK
ncbi:Ig-like domain-containing protein [uncultured Methanobrevibacter sp.]|uniref:Ig-like domain-containing protein n=1 Tax=uncultured Methanobrevibacter sp. TaxID=253161 RepID=UPI00261A93E1|nr:Ig-like domain-containing protein [uncultured Methanobrevibacter sp.]